MTETVTLTADTTDLTDIVNLQYRAAFYLKLGYGCAYFGPDVDDNGNEIEGTLREDLVYSYDGKQVQGFTPDTGQEEVVKPTVKDPVELGTQSYLTPAVGEREDSEYPDEEYGDDDDDEEEDQGFGVCAVPRGLHHGQLHSKSGLRFIMGRVGGRNG